MHGMHRFDAHISANHINCPNHHSLDSFEIREVALLAIVRVDIWTSVRRSDINCKVAVDGQSLASTILEE